MKKTHYFISVYNAEMPNSVEFQTIPGYIFKLNGFMFGVTNKYREKDYSISTGTMWNVTELTSGLLIGISGSTRKEAFNTLAERIATLTPAIDKALRDERNAWNVGRIKYIQETMIPEKERFAALLP